MNRRGVLAVAGALPFAATAGATAPNNRAVVEAFADLFYRKRDVAEAFRRYVAADYVQHNPNIADGRDAAVAALGPMFARPGARFDVRHVLVDGDLAAVHLHAMPRPDSRGGAVVDLFRLAGGLIVEHWDVLQPMPEHPLNPHAMF